MLRNRLVLGMMASGVAIAAADAIAEDTSNKDSIAEVKIGAFIDTYYAYDFNQPPGGDRIRLFPSGNVFMTQPTRQNEFNINLAYVDAKVESDKIRGRAALQMGTSVQANYASDSAIDEARYGGAGAISRYIQEAYVGYQFAPGYWVDGGIFFSHIGFESWISRDNWTYTRSLAAENSPYYQSGVRVIAAISDQLSAHVHIMNGWQNINDTNPQKALGTHIAFSPNSTYTLTYNTFFGYEADGAGNPGSRIFQDFLAKVKVTDSFELGGVFDLGLQKSGDVDSYRSWQVVTLLAHYQATPKVGWAARLEKMIDPTSAVLGAIPTGFNTSGASIGVDVSLQPQLLWRSEVRGFLAAEDCFPTQDGASNSDVFVVSSLALTL